MVGKVGPEQSGNDDRDGNQHAAHGWGAGFFLVGLGAFFTDVLADLKLPKLADDGRANNEGHKHGRQTGKGGTESYIAKDAKRRIVYKQALVKKPVEQSSSIIEFRAFSSALPPVLTILL